jgi:hypothetical protein
MHVVIARLCLLLPSPFALSPEKATPIPTTTHTLSLLKRSLARSVCSDVPAGLSCSQPPAVYALRITLNFSPQKAGAAAARSVVCTTEGPKRRTREGEGSEWEPVKILFKNSAYEPDFTRAPLQTSLAKFT